MTEDELELRRLAAAIAANLCHGCGASADFPGGIYASSAGSVRFLWCQPCWDRHSIVAALAKAGIREPERTQVAERVLARLKR